MQRRTTPSDSFSFRISLRHTPLWLTSLALTAALGCAPELGSPAGGAQPGGNPDDPESQDGNADGTDDDDPESPGPDGEPEFPTSACGERAAPSEFVTLCSGCHGEGGIAPSLYGFAGSQAAFLARVRAGGGGMPAFPEGSIADGKVQALYDYFTSEGDAPTVDLGSVTPLFAERSGTIPITFVRDDGVLVTRAAGRVRQRHELEGTFGPFGPHYFEDRSYGFVIEDFTARGESLVRVTYLPVSNPTDGTNFRAFKVYGDGNVFHLNMGMNQDAPVPSLLRDGTDESSDYANLVAPFARAQVQEVTRNPRDNRELLRGDVFEFEFGVFLDAGAVREGSRTAYYTDTFRYRVGVGGLTPESADTSGELGPVPAAQQGSGTTVAWAYAEPETYYAQMALNIQHEHVQTFLEGRRLFHTDFATGEHSEGGNPVFEEQASKAGPLLVANACETCHVNNGGGKPLAAELDLTSSMAFKLYGAEALGNQLQLGEGSARAADVETKDVTLADGTVVSLQKPSFDVTSSAGEALRFSARVARRLVGMGLLESIPESTLLSRADPSDCDGNGISGRASFVSDPVSGVLRVGRFGWKAEKVSVEHQVADALSADLGVFSHVIKGPAGEEELDEADLSRLSAYMRLLGVPAQRDVANADVQRGEQLFRSVGCANCHAPDTRTGENHPFVELRDQSIRPYTDLLLHDMGEDLADDSAVAVEARADAKASASEWRTPPLWGVGLSEVVQGHVALLHDGRARSVLEAVLWHGGEATSVRERFSGLSASDRAALVSFVQSL